MEDGPPLTPNNMLGTISDNTMDCDLMDGLFDDGCWLETTPSNFWQQGPSPNASDFSSYYFPTVDSNNISHLEQNLQQKDFYEETERLNSSDNMKFVYPQIDERDGSQERMWNASASSTQSESFLFEGDKLNTRLWIAPSVDPNPATSVKNRLIQAFEHLKNTTRDDFLIQIWVPVKSEGRNVLSTNNQPFSLDPKSKSLECYRNVSSSYHFATEEGSKEFFGLPGRVFLQKFPEWSRDVRLLTREQYLRVDYAQQYNVKGSLALPVFERGTGACLGVVEIVTTGTDADCLPEVDDVCKALEAVDLTSSEIFNPHKVKDHDESYRAELAEIKETVTSVCNTHNLPLAQTWAPCNKKNSDQCRYDENSPCISILTSASYVHNEQVLGYHESCCKHHLLRGEGVVGGALMTNQPCFATDISAFSETEYPLAYHAKMLRLHGAVAIRLRSIYTDSMDFIIEFLLPLGCKDLEEQKQTVDSILSQVQQSFCSLRFVSDQELASETLLPVRGKVNIGGKLVEENKNKLVSSSSSEEATRDESSWIAQMVEAQQKGKGILVSLGHQKEEPEEEFMVKTDWINTRGDLYPRIEPSVHKEIVQDGSGGSAKGGGELSSVKGKHSSGAKKAGEHKRIKAERTISLQVLRQYFAGSLKDAAASIGVCPTTLKRICRQHGISRWPSRKIKKVGQSLKKLQLVIDSVQGNEGAIQLSSFYTNFPELSSPNITGISAVSNLKMDNHLKQPQTQHRGSLLSPATTASKSTSSCSHSSSSSYCCSTEAKEMNANIDVSGTGDALSAAGVLKRAVSDVKLHDSGQEDTKFLVRSHSHKLFTEFPPLGSLLPLQKGNSNQALRNGRTFRVKATCGQEKIRFSMPQYWSFTDLQGEISRRLNINIEDVNKVDLRYLDEDSEWILLTCDDDLEECIDIHRSSNARTIKLSLRQARYPNLGSSLDSCGPS